MATKTETKAEVVVTSSPKLVSAIQSLNEATATVESRKVTLGKAIKAESERLGYDESQTRKMVVLSWREARAKETAKMSEEQLAQFDLRARPDISKVMLLAFPAKEQELETALKQNADIRAGKGPKGAKVIGENTLLEIARGNQTVAKHNKGIKPKRKAKGPSKLGPEDQLGNAFVSLYKQFVASESVTEKRARELFDLYFREPEVDEKAAEAQAARDAQAS